MKIHTIVIYTFFFSLCSLNFTWGQSDNLKIEFISVGQTKIWDIGKACEVSLNRSEQWVQEISKVTGIPVNITRIDGDDYNISNIRAYLEQLTFDDPDNTIAIFYGTGHGFNYQENVLKYPVFAVHPDRKQLTASEFGEFGLSLQKDVHDKLLSTGARFVCTIGELCNGLEDLAVPDLYRPMNGCTENYNELFKDIRGDIIAASSRRGQLSYTSALTGGVFFGEFLRSFSDAVDNCDAPADWGTILDNAQRNTTDANGQEPIYDVGYIGTPPTLIPDDQLAQEPKKAKQKKQQRLSYPKKEKFDGAEVKAPKIIYID